ncbi:bacteriohemerythrin [Campylobacterota bacterium DY0563]
MEGKLINPQFTTWDKAYCIGHEKIDSEHKKLFDIANEINVCKEDEEKVIEIVKELIKYTKFHFKNEENFMKSIGFPKLAEHKKLHAKLVKKLGDIVKNITYQPIYLTIIQLSDLVNKNILQHILIEDKKVHYALKTRDELKERFIWKMEYQLRNELLDKEHEKLFDIAIESLNYHNTDIRTHVKITIKELYEYMKTHFKHEEEFMEEIGYPELEAHKKLHEDIIEHMNKFLKSLPKLDITEFEKRLIEYMDIWLINHILYDDRKIINFLKY